LHILALRIICSLLLVGIILLVNRNFAWLTIFKNRKKAMLVILTALSISLNWGLYIWAVIQEHTIEASLGYYINPLISIALGLICLREKLKALQWTAFGMAALGVLILTVLAGSFPWISLSLALSFGAYGLFKKKSTLSALESLGAETLTALPLGLFLLFFNFPQNRGNVQEGIFGLHGLLYISKLPVQTLLILSFCGLITAFPLYCFAKGTRVLPLSTVGFTQFLSPTIQFLLGYFIFNEYFPPHYFMAFICIWIAAILYIVSLRSKHV
jgi:chloramphenicol-sensitive protein RarD